MSTYKDRRDQFERRRRSAARRSAVFANARLVVFAAIVALALLAERDATVLRLSLVTFSLVAFVILVALHRQSRRKEQWFGSLVKLNEQGLARLAREWDVLPTREPSVSIVRHPYAHDLDLYGRASLIQLFGPVGGLGDATLDHWLLSPAPPDVVRRRQEAACELAPMHDVRERVAIFGARIGLGALDVETLSRWGEGEFWLAKRPITLWTARLLAVSTVAAILLHASGVIGAPLWIFPILGTAAFTVGPVRSARTILDGALTKANLISAYSDTFRLLVRASFRARLLRGVQERLTNGQESADSYLMRLSRLADWAGVGRSAMLYFPLQLLTLWDIHVLYALERWRKEVGCLLREWFNAVGQFEAIVSLATLVHDHPDWSFPEFCEDRAAILEADALGHPLLPQAVSVTNDVRLGPEGRILLITGANMAGKSTLLRAIGVAVVLAHAGAAVRARRFRLPRIELWTAMRVDDSLAHGVSYFMAEVERIRDIVNASDRLRLDDQRVLLYLLDDTLRGTNSAERRIAVRGVLHRLLDGGAIGAFATHDLELAECPELALAVKPVHLEMHLETRTGRIVPRFTYKLRHGLATDTNALALMRLMGLGVNRDDR